MSLQDSSELLQARWSTAQVLDLFADLATGAEVRHVQLRTSSADRTVTLADAEAAFTAGEASAIQIRYRFDGQQWSDTIMCGAAEHTIIRNRLFDQ